MARKKMTVLCLLALLLGAVKAHAATFDGHHLATGIAVFYETDHREELRYFQHPEHMETILNYLRLLEYAGTPNADPELLQGDTYRITITLADGQQHMYHLHGDRFLSRDFRPWVKVDSDQQFAELLKNLPEESKIGVS